MQIHIPKRKAKYFNYIEIRIRIESIKKISKPHLLLNGLLFIEKTIQILRVLETILEKFLKSNISCFDGEREKAEVKAKKGFRLFKIDIKIRIKSNKKYQKHIFLNGLLMCVKSMLY